MTVTVNLHAESLAFVTAHRVGQHVWLSLDGNAAIHISARTVQQLQKALNDATVLLDEAVAEKASKLETVGA